MSDVNILRESRGKAAVAFQEFAINASKFSDHVFCFFEGAKGTDNPYYIPRIKNYVTKYYPIRCSGKEQVLKVRDLIAKKAEYAKYFIAFFVDRDFDPSILPERDDVYETPCYSIENLYVKDNVFEEILCSHLGILKSTPEFDICMVLFRKLQHEYHEATLTFNAWYSLLIDFKHATGTETGVKLDDKLPPGFIEISLDGVTSHYDLSTLINTFPKAPKIGIAELLKREQDFKVVDCCYYFRGKYELYFVCKFIDMLITDSKTSKTIFKKPINTTYPTMNNDLAISILSCYANTPACLSSYLENLNVNDLLECTNV